MSAVLNSRVLVVDVNGGVGGGMSEVIAYSSEIDCSRAAAVKVRASYTKAGVDCTIGIVDASGSANTTISGTYDPLLSTRQSSGSSQTTHAITATGRALLAANLGGLTGKIRLSYILSAPGAAGDRLIAEITISEEG